MSSQQFPRHGMPGSTGGPQIPGGGNLVSVNQQGQQAGGDHDSGRDGDHAPQDHPPGGGGASLAFRDDKQETVVVRPYPQVQTHGPPQTAPQPLPIQPGTPVTVSAAPVHLPQGQPPSLSEGPVKVGPPSAGHLSAAAAAAMSGPKTVLRTASAALLPWYQEVQSDSDSSSVTVTPPLSPQTRPPITTTTAVLPTVVAPISASRTQSPVINPAVTQAADMVHGRAGLTIHPPPATISIQRPQASRDATTRITLPSHPALGGSKPQQPHALTQKSIFSTMTPMAAATVAPIVATNAVPSTTTMAPHSQMTSNTIVTMTMASHSSHATAATTSAIPVAKVVPQPIAHTSPRVQPDYTGERTNLIPIPGHRSSPSAVTMEARSDNRSSVPVQFQYFLPAYPSSPYHTYTPITSSVPTLRQYPVTPQAPSSALPSPAGVGVATTVHLNPMQLMAVDRIGLQSPQIGPQGLQPGALTAQGLQPSPMGVQGLHAGASITTAQGLQQGALTAQQNQQPMDAKPGESMVLADGFVASTICSTFGGAQPAATMVQAHTQAVGGAPTLASSPRPSILRKKPTNDGGASGMGGHGSSSLCGPPPGELLPGASPRKKPRKQQHVISTEESEVLETNSTDEERGLGRPITGRAERRESPPREYVDEEGVRYVPVKPRPPVTLLRHYRNPWKAAYHHFQRYSDIRVKEEKKGSLQEMANQRGVACRAQGWKVHLCAAQLRQLSSLEHDVYSRLSGLQEGLMPKKRAAASDDDMHRINELIQGNMQRCKLVMDQVTEARETMMKVLEHKDKVLKLLNKNGSAKKSSKLKRKERA
uniref:Sin3A-associated protein a n=1 Tax=Gadus morhua TaxID=8049 RepID=A0A8C5BZ76_GADMO